MKKRALILLTVAVLAISAALGQDSITLTFSYQTTDGSYLQPDSITIENLTRNWSETLYYPDTVYTLILPTGIPSRAEDNGIQVMPNPFDGTTQVKIQSPKSEYTQMSLTDISGRICAEYSGMLQEGGNLFTITLALPQMYVLTVQTRSGIRSVKLQNTGHASANLIQYEDANRDITPVVQLKSTSPYEFKLGDEMRYRGYSPSRVSSAIRKKQFESEQIYLVFDMHGTPCADQPTMSDLEGNIYNTVQIGDQCWMKENLRTSKFSDGTDIPVGGSVSVSDTEPYYCDFLQYYSPEIPWEERGNYYNWYAALGACPPGWHLPCDSEWTVLNDFVSSQEEYLCYNWYNYIYIAKSLASTSWWAPGPPGGCDAGSEVHTNNATGFSAIPAGFCLGSSSFGHEGEAAFFWSSTESTSDKANNCYLFYWSAYMYFPAAFEKILGHSVRCLRD